MTGEASFKLIPAKTIIIESRKSTYMWGLISEYDSQVSEYANPINEESIKKVLQFIYAMQFSKSGGKLAVKD